MNAEIFEQVFNEQMRRCSDILIVKAREYATDDRLHNFKKTAKLTGETPEQVLAGFMAKHTVSIYDMVSSGENFSDDKWNEKITDHMNYLILLRALITEGKAELSVHHTSE